MDRLRLGAAICGSYCTFEEFMPILEELCGEYDVTAVMSENTAASDTRFGEAAAWRGRIEALTGKPVIDSIQKAEPIGPQKLLDVMLVAPCTGNTLAKLAAGIADTAVTMSVKSHLRNGRPVIVAVSTNDGLSGNARNIGELLNRKNYYFVPFRQDDARGKPTSLIADFTLISSTIKTAVSGRQIQPLLLGPR